jgi:branched-chain amino acid transport system ATP-binding protein
MRETHWSWLALVGERARFSSMSLPQVSTEKPEVQAFDDIICASVNRKRRPIVRSSSTSCRFWCSISESLMVLELRPCHARGAPEDACATRRCGSHSSQQEGRVSETLLAAEGIVAGYGAVTVLRACRWKLKVGGASGLFGPNATARRPAFLETLSGLVRAREGRVTFLGEDITNTTRPPSVKRGPSTRPGQYALSRHGRRDETLEFSAFTVRALARRISPPDRVYHPLPRLKERPGQLAKTLSGRRAAESRSAAGSCACEVFMLDEPHSALLPNCEELQNAIHRLVEEGIPHRPRRAGHIEFLVSLSSRLYLIDHGEVARVIDRRERPRPP